MAKDVKCEVNNCKFWAEGNLCTANKIFIVSHTGKQAGNERETDCQTFEPTV